MFITFEGIDLSGKSTQANALVAGLAQRGIIASLFRLPGSTLLGERIRELLLHSQLPIAPRTNLLLQCASTAELVEEEIKPRLHAGEIVVLDRYIDSGVVYQGAGLGLGMREVLSVYRKAIDEVWPDLTFLLTLPAATAKARMVAGTRLDSYESLGDDFHERLVNGYQLLSCAPLFSPKGRCVTELDACKSRDDTQAAILGMVLTRLQHPERFQLPLPLTYA